MNAIIEVESAFNPWAVRYEPNSEAQSAVVECSRLLGITQLTEQVSQKFSWGLGQVMGSTARSLGYRGPLTLLCSPITGIHWCCEAFQKNGARYAKLEDKIAAYNAGSARKRTNGQYINQSYVDKVMRIYLGKQDED